MSTPRIRINYCPPANGFVIHRPASTLDKDSALYLTPKDKKELIEKRLKDAEHEDSSLFYVLATGDFITEFKAGDWIYLKPDTQPIGMRIGGIEILLVDQYCYNGKSRFHQDESVESLYDVVGAVPVTDEGQLTMSNLPAPSRPQMTVDSPAFAPKIPFSPELTAQIDLMISHQNADISFQSAQESTPAPTGMSPNGNLIK